MRGYLSVANGVAVALSARGPGLQPTSGVTRGSVQGGGGQGSGGPILDKRRKSPGGDFFYEVSPFFLDFHVFFPDFESGL